MTKLAMNFEIKKMNTSTVELGNASPVGNEEPKKVKTALGRERWRGKSIQSRLNALSKVYIVHDELKRLIDHLHRQILFASSRNKSMATLVIAPSGAGKTSFIEYLHRLYPTVRTDEVTERPVVHFQIPAPLTVKKMAEAFLEALGDPLYMTGTLAEKMRRIADLLVTCKVQIIAIDNFHDIPARRGSIGIQAVGDWIRDVCEMKFKGVLLALGTEDAAIVRDSNPQLKRRMMSRVELPLFSIEDLKGRDVFRSLLRAVDASLPLAERSGLEDQDSLPRMYFATAGNLDYLMKLVAMAMMRSVERGVERIEQVDLEGAFKDLHEVAAVGGNPFSSEWNGNALTKPGQVFAPSADLAQVQSAKRKKV